MTAVLWFLVLAVSIPLGVVSLVQVAYVALKARAWLYAALLGLSAATVAGVGWLIIESGAPPLV